MNLRLRLFATLALLSLVFLVLASPVSAQQPGPGAQKLENLAQVLNLTPEQKSQLAPIIINEAPKIQAIKSDPSLSGIQKLRELQAVHNESDPRVRSILTQTQYQEWQSIRKVEIEEMRKGGGR